MDRRNMGMNRAVRWERSASGLEFQCVAAGLLAAHVTVEAIAANVIRVRVTAGAAPAPKPFSYVIDGPAAGASTVTEEPGRLTLRADRIAVEIGLDPWQLAFRTADGRLLTRQVLDDVNFGGHRLGPQPGFEVEGTPIDPAKRVLAVVESLLLDPEDHFYGGGEKFTRLDHVGRTIRIWQRNPYGARSELAYKNIPLLVGSRGYGVFVDVPTAVTFHVGSRSNRAYNIEAEGRELDYYVIAGTPKEIVATYTELTGKPAVPPEWALGLWASTCFVQFTEDWVIDVAQRLRREGIPCDVFHLDSFWQRALMWCDFEWDAARLPDPPRLLRRLHDLGFKSCAWINPYVSAQSAFYQQGAARGYFLKRADGSVYDALVWSQRSERGMGLCALVDFTNPAAAAWYRGKLAELLRMGVDSFKPDFAEEVPADALFSNGLTGAEMHNPYPLLYQRDCYEETRAHAGRAIAWSRSAAPGVQRYPGHWAGDSECTFPDLANTLRGGLASSMSGLAYWSHDIGGFWGTPTPELFVRWAQCGFLSSLSRYHGATPREPWLFGDEALGIFRDYARLRSRLVPYLMSYAWDAAATGIPLMRPMVMEFSDDPAGYAFDLQYTLGRELLVSPVVSEGGWVTTWLPRGRWLDWWSGEIHQGPTTLRRQAPLAELPMYLREDSLLVLGPERSHVGERPADPLTVHAFVTAEATFTVRREDGAGLALRCHRQEHRVRLEATPVVSPATVPGAAPRAGALPTLVLRLRHAPPVARVTADGQALPRLESATLERADRGFVVEGDTVVAKARAGVFELT